MSAPAFAASQERLLAALEAVRDPELDEPITSLGFVPSCTVSAAGGAPGPPRPPPPLCPPHLPFPMGAAAPHPGAAPARVPTAEALPQDHFAAHAVHGS